MQMQNIHGSIAKEKEKISHAVGVDVVLCPGGIHRGNLNVF